MSEIFNLSLGWMPELPDFRDYSIDTEEVQSIFDTATMKLNPLENDGKN